MNPATPAPRWWNRLSIRISLRAMIVLVLVVGGGLGWVVHLARVQRVAVKAIEEAGGRVVYDYGWVDGYSAPSGDAIRWPRWLVDALGPDYFAHPWSVSFFAGQGPKVDDALMDQVGRLGQLEQLNLYGAKLVTDAGLARLRGLTSLRSLDLYGTGTTIDGLVHLSGMTRLRGISLPTGPIDDAGLAHLEGLTALEKLLIMDRSPGVTDVGFGRLKGLVHLRVLTIPSSRVTSKGLGALRDMADLESLQLPGGAIQDLAPIGHLANLNVLDLSDTPIDDAGLAPVASWGKLDILKLEGTRITDRGLAHLRGLGRLSDLRLGRTGVTNLGLASIAGLDRLYRLGLDHTSVDDGAFGRLAGLDRLQYLALDGTPITDRGIADLAGLGSIATVTVDETAVTDGGIEAAQLRRPKAKFLRKVP